LFISLKGGQFSLARRASTCSFASLQTPYPVSSAANPWFLRQCCAVWLGLACAALSRGDEGASPWHAKDVVQYSFENHGLELGLPGTVVTTAIQTRDGYLWVGTPSGLGRFDGVRFTGFAAADTPGLPSDLIHCLREDRQGALWIGTEKGLTRLADGHFTQIGFENQSVRALAEDEAGNLWVGTWGDGVFVLRAGRPEPFRSAGVPADLRVRALFADSGGRVWVAQDKARGLFCVDRSGVLRPFDGGDAVLGEVLTIAELPRGTLWFGTKRDGLFRLKDDRLTRHGEAEGIGNTPVYEIHEARSGGLWLAAGTLFHVTTAELPGFTPIRGLPNRNVQAVCEDREGGVWLCAGAEGLTRMRELPYRLLSSRQGLPTDNVKNVSEDASGGLWLATQGAGVVRVGREGAVTIQRANGGPPDGDPAVVYAARDGSVWAGASSHLWVRRDGEWRQYSELRSVRGLFEDRAGVMWIGTEADGLFRHEQGRITEVKTAAGGRVPFATSFAEAADGTMIVGTWRSGIWKVGAGSATAHEWVEGLAAAEVRAVHADRDGRLWAGLNHRGLVVWENGRSLNPPALTKALGSSVSAIVEEESGRVWLGTLAGLVWARKDELLAWMRAPVSAPPIHAMPVGDETGIIPVWSGAQPVVWRAASGDLLFATRRGVLAIDAGRVTLSAVPPPVHVERVFVDRHGVETRGPVSLPPGARSLAVEYAAPSFVQAERVLFRHKLEGYDADWVDAATRRTAFYGSLPPGNYTFRVRACNSDGVWNETGASVAIMQLPYFYQTAWFRWLLAGAVVTAAAGLYRWSNRRLRQKVERLERERAMDNERRRIAQDLHDDLGASLTEIGLFADATRRTAPPAEQAGLDYLAQRARALVGSLDAIVWSVNPANDSLDHLVMYVGELFQELFRSSAIRGRMDIPPGIPRLPLTAEERSDIFLTTKEAMNNILKHSGATEASLRIRMEDDSLRIVLRDNGRGFVHATASAAGGNGLANMRARIARTRGTLEWRTAPGEGTEIIIEVSFAGRKELPEPA
jgi:ligand-binding sensor domain-containing protein/signal transduction histidine kinase